MTLFFIYNIIKLTKRAEDSNELLNLQGIRWYSPSFEYIPKKKDFVYPESRHYAYACAEGRGFHFEDLQNESESFLIWMARNRMSTHACHSHCKALQEKLGMIFATGGHIFEKILHPDNLTPDGRTFLDAHRDWYGKGTEELTAQNARGTQFCVSNTELLDYLSDIIIKKLNNEWKDADIIAVDGFDTWGNTCQCEECNKLGNGSDKTLKMIAHFRRRLNEAVARGEVRDGVKISFCSYEGTCTLEPPINPVPKELLEAGDYTQFAPILRCYEHDFNYPCDRNQKYIDCFEGWCKTGIKTCMLEYYNVSKYEDLPIVFTKRIANDVKYYIDQGINACVYMHVFVKEWGVRALNHFLYAEVMRNPEADVPALVSEYYENVYGAHKGLAKNVYDKLEDATALISSYRSWDRYNILSAINRWDGSKPTEPLDVDMHVRGREIELLNKTVKQIGEALDGLREIRTRELSAIKPESFSSISGAVNPAMLAQMQRGASFLDKINEDIRGVKYGYDVFSLMALFVEYYEALRLDKPDSDAIFEKLKALGLEMCEYTFSVVFDSYEPEFELRDALLRSQLKQLFYKCIALKN